MAEYGQGGPYASGAHNGVQNGAGQTEFNQQVHTDSAAGNSAEDYTPRTDDQGARGGPSGNQGQMQQTFSPQAYSSGPRPSSGGPPPGMGGTAFVPGKIFIGGLANTTTKDQLESYCAQWGEMSDIVLMEGRGFGFVTYTDPQCAQAFLEKKDHELDHKKIEAKAAVPKNAGGSSGLTRKMFVGGTGELGEEEFRAHFGQFGDIEDSVILRKPDGTSRGFGFVTYRDESMVEKCLVVQHVISGKTVEVKRAVKKEDMAAGAGYDQSYAARTGKAPDWHCPECRNKNFGWREVCNRCQAPKPMMGGGMGMMAGGAMMGGMRSGYGGEGAYMTPGGNMGMGGMGMGAHSMAMNLGNMSPQMGEMGGMGGMAGYGHMGGMGGNMGHMGGYGGGMGGGRGNMGGYGGMGNKMSPQMGAGGMAAAGGMGSNYGSGGGGAYGQMQQQGAGYGQAYSEGGAGAYDMSGGQTAGGYGGGAGAGGAYGGGAGYGGAQGQAGPYGSNAGYGGNAAANYGDGSGGYGQQGSYGRAAPGRGSMGHARYRPY